jgi:hypothetical protein
LGDELLGVWAVRYLRSLAHLKPKTRASYESLVRTTILPTFEVVPLAAIRPSMIREWVAGLLASGLSASRVRQSYHLLGAMLAAAVADGMLASSPTCRLVKSPPWRGRCRRRSICWWMCWGTAACGSGRRRRFVGTL